jgi:hypothetical protein
LYVTPPNHFSGFVFIGTNFSFGFSSRIATVATKSFHLSHDKHPLFPGVHATFFYIEKAFLLFLFYLY